MALSYHPGRPATIVFPYVWLTVLSVSPGKLCRCPCFGKHGPVIQTQKPPPSLHLMFIFLRRGKKKKPRANERAGAKKPSYSAFAGPIFEAGPGDKPMRCGKRAALRRGIGKVLLFYSSKQMHGALGKDDTHRRSAAWTGGQRNGKAQLVTKLSAQVEPIPVDLA